MAEEQEPEPAHAVTWLEAEEHQELPRPGKPVGERSPASGEARPQPDQAPHGPAQDQDAGGRGPPGRLRRAAEHVHAERLVRHLVLAGLVLAVGLGAFSWLEDRITLRQEILENTRFVRQVAIDPQARAQPFAGLLLRGAHLAGLDVACRDSGDTPGAPDICADLSGTDLSDANLSGAILVGADLHDADLSGADLSDADLSEAKLYGADLSDADLSAANLAAANLIGAHLSGADLSETDLSTATLLLADLADSDLQYAYLFGANLTDADLAGADLSGANLSGANLSGADLAAADLAGANFSGARFDDSTRWPDGFTPPK